MATLSQLAGKGKPLDRINLDLDEGLPHRFLYGTEAFLHWMESILPTMTTGLLQADITPYEQVAERFRQFIVGEHMGPLDRRFAPLSCRPGKPDPFVWEIKTIDVRVFGWIAKMDHFVCCFGDHADHVKEHRLYEGYMREVERIRSALPLDEPKTITHRNYENALSDAD